MTLLRKGNEESNNGAAIGEEEYAQIVEGREQRRKHSGIHGAALDRWYGKIPAGDYRNTVGHASELAELQSILKKCARRIVG